MKNALLNAVLERIKSVEHKQNFITLSSFNNDGTYNRGLAKHYLSKQITINLRRQLKRRGYKSMLVKNKDFGKCGDQIFVYWA